MLVNIFGRRINAHVRQSDSLEVETGQLVAGYLESARFPVAVNSLP